MIAGRYALEHEIGRGGAGVVWLGTDELLGRQVALKRIGLVPGADRTDLARAEREARLGARLSHPHVVAVFDTVEDDTGAHWLVMEHVDGVDLGQLIRDRGPLPPGETAALLRQAADALVAAHAAGITHRDVKPSNMLLDRAGTVKLTDFGIARVTTDATLTQTGMVTGSPAYLAPEVAAGARGDAAADVWSLGATAFALLAGRAPYDTGDNVLGALYRIVHDDPPALPEAGPLAALLAGTMAKDPAQRWPMTQVRKFLDEAVLPADPGVQRTRVLPVPPASPAALTGSRWTVPLAAGGLLVLLILVALWVGRSGDNGGTVAAAPPTSPTASATGAAADRPTVRGMESFIRRYVATVSAEPDAAWSMLTPKFQRESGGLDTYRRYWDAASNGRVLSISADPATLQVSYQVHFDHFHNGPGPTILDLAYVDGRYLIDGEETQGFHPAEQRPGKESHGHHGRGHGPGKDDH
jgi:serine/threonine protein kinase